MSRKLANGLEVVQMGEDWVQRQHKKHGMYKHGIVRILPDGWLYPGRAPYFIDKIHSFEYRPDDIIIMTFPKAGTTWMQEIIWTMVHNPDLNHPEANNSILFRSIDISQDMLHDTEEVEDMELDDFADRFAKMCPGKDIGDGMLIEMVRVMPGRRIIKTHLPLSLMTPGLLDKAKVIYVARNPKDTLVSGYYFAQVMKMYRFSGTFEEYIRDCMTNDVVYHPFWPHVKQAWQQRDHPNMHFVFYEDLKKDVMKELRSLDAFIDTGLTDTQLENVAKHTSFSSMKSRGDPVKKGNFKKEKLQTETVFTRKGQVGDWKNLFSPELDEEVNQWIKKNLKDTDIPFYYEQ